MAAKRWMPDHPDDDDNQAKHPSAYGPQEETDSSDRTDQSDRSVGSDRSRRSDRSGKSEASDGSDLSNSPPSPAPSFPSLDGLGKPPADDPLQWNPRLREVLDLIRGLSSADLQHALISLGFVREEDVLQALAVECEMERLDWNTVNVTPDLLAQIPTELAWRHHVFPIRYDATTLWVAVDNPLDPRILSDLEDALAKPVRGMIASEGEILRMLGMHYG